MRHPILSGSGYKPYTLVWVFVMLIHAGVLYFFYDYPLQIATADSLTHNLLFGSIAPGFWYIVSFANLTKDELSLAGTHLVAAVLSVLLWATISRRVLQFFFVSETAYLQFLEDSYIWRLIIGVMYYSITILMFYLIKYYQDMQSRMNRELELQNLLKDSELKMLKSQINPHFIFNSLNSVSALTITKPENAREMVIKLSDFLRYSLGKDSIEMNSLMQEIENVSLYLDIEKVRFGSKLKFEKEIEETCADVKVPNLILQPLFENAIKYGMYDSMEDVTIQLKCEQKEDELHLWIINNFDADAVASKGAGIGLANVRKRLSLVFGRNDLLQIEEREGEFRVLMKIPTNQLHE